MEYEFSQEVVLKFAENHWKIGQNGPQNGTKFLKNWPLEPPWSTLGTLLAPRWPKSDTKNKILWKILNFRVVLGVQNGVKIDKQSDKKIDLIFVTISKALFLDLGSILSPKTSPKWRVSDHFFNLVANMWKVWFWTALPSFYYIFRL